RARLTSSASCRVIAVRPPPPSSTLFPYTTLFRSGLRGHAAQGLLPAVPGQQGAHEVRLRGGVRGGDPQRLGRVDGNPGEAGPRQDRKSTRLNSSHVEISYAVFCLKKKNTHQPHARRHTNGTRTTSNKNNTQQTSNVNPTEITNNAQISDTINCNQTKYKPKSTNSI